MCHICLVFCSCYPSLNTELTGEFTCIAKSVGFRCWYQEAIQVCVIHENIIQLNFIINFNIQCKRMPLEGYFFTYLLLRLFLYNLIVSFVMLFDNNQYCHHFGNEAFTYI